MHVFTLPQTLLILIVAGFITVVILSRLTPDDQSLTGAADILRMHIRHAQTFSQSYKHIYGLQSIQNIGYVLFETSPENISKLPGTEDIYRLKGSITISSFTLYFNKEGTPCTDLTGSTPLPHDLTITLQDGIKSETVTVMPHNGFIA
ncbi:hypothetical protein [Halodesulfovibrio aestuarii]|uniref:Type II secretion system protein n=1 Tax=Halodesulfovibrio aestuarii TaxID=126333 RepID=A0ABV4JXS6_9BACT